MTADRTTLRDLRSLARNGDFVHLFCGRIVTNLGDGLYFVAAMWLVYQLTGSTFYTGLAGVLTRGPQAFRFLVGPLVDRLSLDRALVAPQIAQACMVLVVPLAAVYGRLSVFVVLAVMPLVSLVGQLDDSAQNAAVPRVVNTTLLTRANSVYAFVARSTQSLSTALSGVLVTVIGAVSMYVLDSVTFVVAALLFGTIRFAEPGESAESDEQGDSDETVPENDASQDSYLSELREGFSLVASSIVLPMVLGAALATSLIGVSYAVLPAYAERLGSATTYGLLVGAVNAELLVGSAVATVVEDRPLGRLTIGAFALAGLCWLVGISLSHRIGTALLFAFAWVPIGAYNVLILSAVQTGVPDEYLGRVMATAGSANGAAYPLGSLLGGVLGESVSSPMVLSVAGLGFLALSGYWFVRSPLRTFRPTVEVEPGSFDIGKEGNQDSSVSAR